MKSIEELKIFLIQQKKDNGGKTSSKDMESPEGVDEQLSCIPEDSPTGLIMYLDRGKKTESEDGTRRTMEISIRSMHLDMREGTPRVISRARYLELRNGNR